MVPAVVGSTGSEKSTRTELRPSAAASRSSGAKVSPDGEGGWYLNENFDFLSDNLRGNKSGLAQFILFMRSESKQVVAQDAGLTISWDDLRKRIIRFETFCTRYPKLPETRQRVERELSTLMSYYLSGIDNTPAYPRSTRKLNNGLKQSYEAFLRENTASSYYSVIKNVYEILSKNGFKKSREVDILIADVK